eukprot:g2425.t1
MLELEQPLDTRLRSILGDDEALQGGGGKTAAAEDATVPPFSSIAAASLQTSSLDAQIIHLHYLGANLTEWNTWGDDKRNEERLRFIVWRSQTSQLLVLRLLVFGGLTMTILFACILVYSKHEDALFPATLVRADDGSMRFVQQRRLPMQLALVFGLIGAPVFAWFQNYDLLFTFFFFGLLTVAPPIFMVIICAQRATTSALSVSLAQCKNEEEVSTWKNTWYKPAIGLLRVWSGKLSPFLFSAFCTLELSFLGALYQAFVIRAQFGRQQGGANHALEMMVMEQEAFLFGQGFFYAVIIFVCLSAVSAPSIYFGQIRLVLSLIPETGHMEDIMTLQESQAAFGLFGVGITAGRSFECLKLLLLTSVLSMWGWANSAPFGTMSFDSALAKLDSFKVEM